MTSALARQKEIANEQFYIKRLELLASTIDKSTLEFLYIKWTTKANIPFNQVEDKDFRVFLEYLNPAANKQLPSSHNTIRGRIMKLFLEGKQRVKDNLHAALSEIHLTCDLLTSSNQLALLGINAHFTSEYQCLKMVTIGLKEVFGAHSGENQAEIIWNLLDEYGVFNKNGYFIMDNAPNNDTMVENLATRFENRFITFNPI